MKVVIGVSGAEHHLLTYVADIEGPFLLGQDYLVQCEALVDFKRKSLQVGDVTVPSVDLNMVVR